MRVRKRLCPMGFTRAKRPVIRGRTITCHFGRIATGSGGGGGGGGGDDDHAKDDPLEVAASAVGVAGMPTEKAVGGFASSLPTDCDHASARSLGGRPDASAAAIR